MAKSTLHALESLTAPQPHYRLPSPAALIAVNHSIKMAASWRRQFCSSHRLKRQLCLVQTGLHVMLSSTTETGPDQKLRAYTASLQPSL